MNVIEVKSVSELPAGVELVECRSAIDDPETLALLYRLRHGVEPDRAYHLEAGRVHRFWLEENGQKS